MPSGARYWCFTLNNYSPEDECLLANLCSSNPDFAYVGYGREQAQSGTRHLQGFFELRKRVRCSVLKAHLGARFHLEVRKGSFEQNVEYCSKEGDFQSWGERVSVGQGKRSDLDAVARDLRSGSRILDVASEHPSAFIRYSRGIREYARLFQRRTFESFNGPFYWNVVLADSASTILWGAAGIGKTEYAKYLLPNALFVTHLDDLTLLVDGDYDGIIFDDMCFTHLPRTSQIHLLDCDNDRSIHVRYATALIRARTKKVFLTNVVDGFIFDLLDPAIARRANVVHLEPPFLARV